MSQVTRTTNELIVNSLYLTGQLGVGETPDAYMLSTGIELINEILDNFSADGIYIPYLTTLSFTMTPSQGTYSISTNSGADISGNRIIDLTFVNYSVVSSGNTVIYPITIITKDNFFLITRLNPIETRPCFAVLNKQADASYITFYPTPDQAYPCEIRCKSMLNSVIPHQTLNDLPPYFYGALKYTLARKFIAYYPSSNWSQQNEDFYQEYMENLKSSNELNLDVRPSGILDVKQPYNWTDILAY